MFIIACLNLFLLCTVVHDLISCLVKERMNSFFFVSYSLFFETMTSTVGLGYMVSPRAFWFQVGSFEVHARSGIWSASFSRSLVFLDTYRLNLQALRLRLMNDCSSPKNPKQTSIWNLPLHPRQCIMLKRHYEGGRSLKRSANICNAWKNTSGHCTFNFLKIYILYKCSFFWAQFEQLTGTAQTLTSECNKFFHLGTGEKKAIFWSEIPYPLVG